MRKISFFLIVIMAFSFFAFASTIAQTFYKARASQNATVMVKLIDKLKSMPNIDQDATYLGILADACVEYGLWGAPAKEKAKYFEKGIDYSEKALKIEPKNAYFYFIKGAAIGRLAQYRGIIQSLFMLRDFDHALYTAIKLDPKLYRADVALGMRYRDTPWPFANFGKSEKFFEDAIQIDPHYIYAYYELAQLYLKWHKEKKARGIFKKMISMKPEKEFRVQEEKNIEYAKEWLKEHP